MKKVVIVRYLPRKRGKYLNDDDGLRRGVLLHELSLSNALRMTEEFKALTLASEVLQFQVTRT